MPDALARLGEHGESERRWPARLGKKVRGVGPAGQREEGYLVFQILQKGQRSLGNY